MKRTAIFLLSMEVLLGCFPWDKENHIEISPEPKTKVDILLHDMPDTVNMVNDISVNYSIFVPDATPIAVFYSLGNDVHYLGYQRSGKIFIASNAKSLSLVGNIPFELAVFSTTETGSLADRSQRELLLFSETRILYFDYSPIVALNFTSAEIREGAVQLTWPAYPHKNLRSLKLRKRYKKTDSQFRSTEIVTLSSHTASYVEDRFIGPEIEYDLITENSINEVAQGQSTTLVTEIGEVKKFETVGGQVRLTWSRPRLYASTSGYQILDKGHVLDVNKTILATTMNAADTTVLLTVPFGDDFEVIVRAVSKDPAFNAGYEANIWSGRKLRAPAQIFHHHSTQEFYLLHQGYVRRLHDSTMDSASLDYDHFGAACVSVPGGKLFVSEGHTISELSSDLAVVSTFQTSGGQPSTAFLPFGTSIILFRPTGPNATLIQIWNRATGLLVSSYQGQSSLPYLSHSRFSYSSEYMTADGDGNSCVFKISNSGTIEWDKCFLGALTCVVSKDSQHLYVLISGKISKYTLPDLQQVMRTDPTGTNTFGAVDHKNRQFVRTLNGFLEIVDIESMTVLFRFPAKGTNPALTSLIDGAFYVKSSTNSSQAFLLDP